MVPIAINPVRVMSIYELTNCWKDFTFKKYLCIYLVVSGLSCGM